MQLMDSEQLADIALVAGSYLSGAVPYGWLVARAKGVNLRSVGSGNIGATNVKRALGLGWAVAVLVLDALKGFGPVLAARYLSSGAPAVVAGCMIAAVAGHVFPVFLGFRGGKGVATGLGVTLAASPLAALCGAAAYGAVLAVVRISSVGSLVGVGVTLIAMLLLHTAPETAIALGVVAVLIVARHAGNLRRLIQGKER